MSVRPNLNPPYGNSDTYAMLDQDFNSRDRARRRGRRHHGGAIAFSCLSLMAGPGCGLDDAATGSGASTAIIRGKDSAGATIELEQRRGHFARVRVVDVVLGTAEAEVNSTDDRRVEFTIRFPAGATITYIGRHDDDRASGDVRLSGTWQQHPGGVFGTDFGTWEAPSLANEG